MYPYSKLVMPSVPLTSWSVVAAATIPTTGVIFRAMITAKIGAISQPEAIPLKLQIAKQVVLLQQLLKSATYVVVRPVPEQLQQMTTPYVWMLVLLSSQRHLMAIAIYRQGLQQYMY